MLLAVLGVIVATSVWFTVGRDAVASLLESWERDEPAPQDPASPAPPEEPTGPSAEELANPVPCVSDAVEIALSLGSSAPVAGDPLRMTVTVTNIGQVPCLVDLGHESLRLAITSGEDMVWNTAQCPAGPAQRMLLLDLETEVTQRVTWRGQRCDNDREATAGTYRFEVTLPTGDGEVQVREVSELN